MAKIVLDPQESFEHFHSEDSYTVLLQGEAIYIVDGKEQELQVDAPIFTPANRSHILRNIGNIECILGCGHGTGGGPEQNETF